MNCNCFEDLGCFMPNDLIEFNIAAHCTGDYVFEISYRGRIMIETVSFTIGDPLALPFTFDESGEIKIKIKVPSNTVDCPSLPGFNYITTLNGACVFVVKGAAPTC